MSPSSSGSSRGRWRVAARSIAYGSVSFLVASQLFATAATTGLYVAGATVLVSLAVATLRSGGSTREGTGAAAPASCPQGVDVGTPGRADPEIEAEPETPGREVEGNGGTAVPAAPEPTVEAASGVSAAEPPDPGQIEPASGGPADRSAADAAPAGMTAPGGPPTDEVASRIDGALAAAAEARREGRRLAEHGEPESAVLDRVEEGRESCERAAELARTHGMDREDDIADLRAELDGLAERVAARSELVATAEERLAAARRAVESHDLGDAEGAVEDAERALDELDAEGGAEGVLDPLWSELGDVEAAIATRRAKSTVVGSLGSVEAALSKAEDFLESGDHDRAETRLESALETIARADALNREYGLDRGDALAAKRDSVEAKLDEARVRPTEELAASLEAGEAAVSRGIDRREAGDLAAAAEAFEEARRTYEAALEVAERFDPAARWEVEQRRSMVAGYLEVTGEERDERRRSVETDLERQLENAGTALDRAEQYAEVDDHVSARGSLDSAVRSLEEAARLVDTGVVGEGPTARYESLVGRADALHGRLPAEPETGAYRTRDLLSSLQSLATKLGESPRPEFVNAYGAYPADAYLETFGSWPEALAAANLDPVDEAARGRRTYSRVEVLDALAELAAELDHPPSKGEMNSRGSMSASPVAARFADWETALELAGVAEGPDGDPDGGRNPVRGEPAPSGTGSGQDAESRPAEGSGPARGDTGTSESASGDDEPEDVLGAIERELGSFADRTDRGDAGG